MACFLLVPSVYTFCLQEAPYVRLKQDHWRRLANDKYEGFCIDLLREVAEMLDFRYEIYLVPDGKFGNKRPDGTWNGLVQQLMDGVSITCQSIWGC